MENKIKIYADYFKKGYELAKGNIPTISYVAYGIGLVIQVIILSIIAGLYWMSYVSFQFSLVLFVMIAFLLILSVPTTILFIVFLFLLSVTHVWNDGWFWKIFIAAYALFLGSLPLTMAWVKGRWPRLIERIKGAKVSDSVGTYFLRWSVLIFMAIISMFMYFTFFPQVAKVNTSNYWNILGKYLFYNQNYYFLEVCGETLILPSDQVNGISIALTRSEINDPTKKTKMDELNKKYLDFCNNEFLKKF